MDDNKFDEVLKIESEYLHLDTKIDDPNKDLYAFYAFGRAHESGL